MSHPSEAQLLAFVDRELEDARRREVEAHVRSCDLCRHALRDVEQAMAGMAVELALIDTEEPARWQPVVTVQRTDRRAGRGVARERSTSFAATPVPADASRHAARPLRPMRVAAARTPGLLRWAAVLLVIVGGGAAAMTAPRWFSREAVPAADAIVAAPVAAPSANVATSSAAVSILPVAGEATVVLTAGPGGGDGRVVVELSDRSDVQVTVTTAASEQATPRFTSADGRLAVQLAGRGALVRVAVPAALRAARVTYDGKTVATVADGVVAPDEARSTGVALSASSTLRRTEPR